MDFGARLIFTFTNTQARDAVATCFLVSVTAVLYTAWQRLHQRRSRKQVGTQRHGISIHTPQILRCNISHHRLFPKRHKFTYSYLSVGIPVRLPTSNWLLSVDTTKWWERGWLHVTAEDHLGRDGEGKSLSEHLDCYLREQVSISLLKSAFLLGSNGFPQGLEPAEFPNVYLLTSARFLNYKFSPASFWYLYTTELDLRYVIAEVNNTFNERRMYLFPAPGRHRAFKQSHPKDFHVSPFNSRKGSYVVSTANPAKGEDVSATVTLQSSKGHPKLVARWWSVATAIDPSTYSTLRSIWFLACWGWTVLITCKPL